MTGNKEAGSQIIIPQWLFRILNRLLPLLGVIGVLFGMMWIQDEMGMNTNSPIELFVMIVPALLAGGFIRRQLPRMLTLRCPKCAAVAENVGIRPLKLRCTRCNHQWLVY